MKQVYYIFLLGMCCFGFTDTNGQVVSKQLLDSVISLAYKKNPDTNAVKAFVELQRYYFNLGQYDSALYYCKASLPIAQKVNNADKLSRIYYNTGLVYTNLTRYDSAKKYIDLALQMALQNKDTALLINSYNSNALLSNYQSDFKTAVEFMTKVASLIENSNNPVFDIYLPQTYGNIGHNLIAENFFVKGIEYEKKALLIEGYPDEQRYRVMLHLDIADAYIKMGNNAVAKHHLDTAVAANATLKNIQVTSLVLNSQGFYYDAIRNLPASLNAYLQTYQIADSTQSFYLKAEAADNVAKIYSKMNKGDLAEKFAGIGNDIAKNLQHYKVAASTYETLKKVAAAKGEYKKALLMSEKYMLYADSATNTASQKFTVYLEALYQKEKKENDIAALTISNNKKELAVIKRDRILLFGGIAASALLFLMGLLYRFNRQKRMLAEKDTMLQQERVKWLEGQQQVVSLQSMLNGQETERTRIAKDLHDGLGGLFSTIKMYFSTIKHEMPNVGQHELFAKSYEMVDTASEEVRRIAHNMMPEVLIKLGLIHALTEMSNSISAGKLIKVSLQAYGMEKRLHPSTEIMLFRIVQELMNNIIKHAHATEALIQLNRLANQLTIIVEDNGRGFKVEDQANTTKAGLETIKSRVHYLNGKIAIDSGVETGTTVMMDFLLNEA